jgi:hypothetical protein
MLGGSCDIPFNTSLGVSIFVGLELLPNFLIFSNSPSLN